MTGILEKNIQHIPYVQESKKKKISKLRSTMKYKKRDAKSTSRFK